MLVKSFEMFNEDGTLIGAWDVNGQPIAKSHVSQYVRKDGTVVKEHDTSRQAAPKDWRDEENWHTRTMGRMKTLSEAELRYIIKDATEAAEVGEKSGWSQEKTGKYRDEAHYASMELHKRGQGVREAKAKHDAEKAG